MFFGDDEDEEEVDSIAVASVMPLPVERRAPPLAEE